MKKEELLNIIYSAMAGKLSKEDVKKSVDKFTEGLVKTIALLEKGVEDVTRLIDNIILEEEAKAQKYETSSVKCDLCSNEWIVVRPEGLRQLECPKCENMVHFENI